jgi:hypothetical protein
MGARMMGTPRAQRKTLVVQRRRAIRRAIYLIAVCFLCARGCRWADRIQLDLGAFSARVNLGDFRCTCTIASGAHFRSAWSISELSWMPRGLYGRCFEIWNGLKFRYQPPTTLVLNGVSSRPLNRGTYTGLGFLFRPPYPATSNETDSILIAVGFQMWIPLIVSALLTVRSVRAARRAAYRINSGRCVACGYDLRSTKSRCPECGAAP